MSKTATLIITCILTTKIKQEIDYLITGPGMEANRMVSAETTLQIHENLVMYLMELGASKALSP